MSAVETPAERLLGRILALAPFGRPDAALIAAAARGGAFPILELGPDSRVAARALEALTRIHHGPFGVRFPLGNKLDVTLPGGARAVVFGSPEAFDAQLAAGRITVIEVTSVAEAEAAQGLAHALIAKGHEAAGRVGEETTFVLLQHLSAHTTLPLYARGGIGLHTAAAAFAGGAWGIVLDGALALARESALAEPLRSKVAAMDGSETVVLHGVRVLHRPEKSALERSLASASEVLAALNEPDGLVPLGQDAAFAKPLALRFRGAAGIVHGIKKQAGIALRETLARPPLGPASAFAKALRVGRPILQGPMTRVSDKPAFAEAVAAGQGIPFLALSLLKGPEVRALLKETQHRVGGHTWGVGILGFVPEELRAEQMAALADFPPPVAIIAGGRPAQAAPLEAKGTLVYLHVPSPGLLDLFLAEGARRFIFEGRECGGHVGPRTSFVLWEQQVARLTAFIDAQKGETAPGEPTLSVVFAGGIHDARSAAMVGALAAPLAARGVEVAVLLGTAYLFTEEAVATQAIGPVFQEQAVACSQTSLLETAPGHATRCVETPFVEAFRAEKERLSAAGADAETLWQNLERLNLGRLRVASKGKTRQGENLVDVDADTQRREGMFMIGQVAALRSERTTVEALHAEVSEGSAAFLATQSAAVSTLANALDPAENKPERPAAAIAIVGMAGIFPGAPDLATFWSNIVAGRDAVREVPKERWDASIYYDAAGGPDKTPSKWGGFIDDVPFDPLSYGIPPRSLPSIEPVQLLSLEVARRALVDAGYGERPFDRERASVVFGAEGGTDLSNAYGFRALYPQLAGELPQVLAEHLPKLTEDSFPGVLANVIAGRIANRLDLGGVNYTVDAACASSLAAVDVAVKELTAGTSDLVLCGGADLHNGIHDYLMFASVHALSPGGRCRTFDASADGISLGEGVACLVLKRLADAERDGDRVYAVIHGIAGGSDGKSLGLTAPRKEGQIRAVCRAYVHAHVSPSEVGLVEAHGTGTVVGDRTELATLTEVFAAAETPVGRTTLGSVKSQIGHTKCAAGLAGIVKAALAVHHGVLPPTIHVERPNPYWDASTSPFVFGDSARPWLESRRLAGVSAFGFGGTNFHCVLGKEGDAVEGGAGPWPAELVLIRGRDASEALSHIDKLLLLAKGRHSLRDLAASACLGRGAVFAALVVSDKNDLLSKLGHAREALAEGRSEAHDDVFVTQENSPQGGLALLFPGQGSQRPGMLRELFVTFPSLHRLLARAPAIAPRMLPPAGFSPLDQRNRVAALTDTRVAQPALGIADLALSELLTRAGVVPQMVAGHSYGELAALTFAGAIDEADLVPLSEARAASILEAAGDDPGAMAAVTASAETTRRALAENTALVGVVVANENAPDQTVIAGPTELIEAAVAHLEQRGIGAKRITVACAFHSPVVASARERFAGHLALTKLRTPRLPVYSNTTAAPHADEPHTLRETLADHIVKPVRFAAEIEAMYAAGARIFVEAGPGRVLSALVSRILGDRPHRAIACDQATGSGLAHFLRALAQLATLGVPIETRFLFEPRGVVPFDLARAPDASLPPSTWLITGQHTRPLTGELPAGSFRPTLRPILRAGEASSPPPSAEEAVVVQYLQGMRDLARAQRDVMLRFLGSSPAAAVLEATFDEEPSTNRVAATAVVSAEIVPAASNQTPAEILLDIVAERTGYPIEMLDLDLNLEAELSIDSIKRIEILGVLSGRLGLSSTGSEEGRKIVEQLARVKTLRGILDWLDARAKGEDGTKTLPSPAHLTEPQARPALEMGSPPTAPAATPNTLPSPGPAAAHSDVIPRAATAVVRLVPHLALTPVDARASIASLQVAVIDDGEGFAPGMVEQLTLSGARAALIDASTSLQGFDAVVHLGPLAERASDTDSVSRSALRAFEIVKRCAEADISRLIVAVWVSPSHVPFAPPRHLVPVGWSGLLATLAKERPGMRATVVGFNASSSPLEAVEILAQELSANASSEVTIVEGERHVLSYRAAALSAPSRAFSLDPDAVVVVTGGARGITAKVALALAKRSGARLEIIGRSALPTAPEDADTALLTEPKALRKHLASRGDLAGPRAIEGALQRLLIERELRDNMAAFEAVSARVRYHAVDVTNDEALGGLLDQLYIEHGHIDGLIHGAGIVEDRFIADKTPASFARVFDTKVRPALVFADKLRSPLRFAAFFGSVVGALGNAGQADYAAANAALADIARSLEARLSTKVACFHWGPWAGAGMVQADLARAYEQSGIELLSLADGIEAFFAELGTPRADDPAVIVLRDNPKAPLRAFRDPSFIDHHAAE